MIYRTRPTVFLDLDHTLICSLKQNSRGSKVARRNLGDPVVSFANYDVYKRPHVDSFLKHLFENYFVGVWTAASADYAAVVTAHVILASDDSRRLDMMLTSDDTNAASEKLGGNKNLKALWNMWNASDLIPEGWAIIVDDLQEVCDTQPERCVMVEPFDASDANAANDVVLLKAIDDIKTKARNSTRSGW